MTRKNVRITDSEDYTDNTDSAAPSPSSSVKSSNPCQSVIQTPPRPAYKQTEVGAIPEDWDVRACAEICLKIQDGTHFSPSTGGNDYLYVTSKHIGFGILDASSADRIDAAQHKAIYQRCDVKKGDLLLTKDGANTGNAAVNNLEEQISLLSSVAFLRFDATKHVPDYFLQQIVQVSFCNLAGGLSVL
jgi:hypothetical protein